MEGVVKGPSRRTALVVNLEINVTIKPKIKLCLAKAFGNISNSEILLLRSIYMSVLELDHLT